MTDSRTLAFCNLFGVLGAIPTLLDIAPEARAIVADATLSVGFAVKNGPSATLRFEGGAARMTEGTQGCSIRLFFPCPDKFNALIDGKGTPIPTSGFRHVGFLLGPFTRLTDILAAYLRPTETALNDPTFFARSTELMLHVIAGAVAAVGNEDKVGRFSASNIVDGTVRLAIGRVGQDDLAVGIDVCDHRLTALHTAPAESLSEMRFDSLETARALFDGKLNAIAAVGEGKVRVGGMIAQLDNINRILDRVALYLA